MKRIPRGKIAVNRTAVVSGKREQILRNENRTSKKGEERKEQSGARAGMPDNVTTDFKLGANR